MRENTDQNNSEHGQFSHGVTPAAVPVDGNESDIDGGGDESDGSNESETEGDTEKSDSNENEYEEATDSAANGRKGESEGQKKKRIRHGQRQNGPSNFNPNTSPIQFFELFCDDEFFQLAVDQ